MRPINNLYLVPIAVIIIILSISALLVNHYIFKFPGNNFFPPNTPLIAANLVLMYIGASLLLGNKSKLSQYLLEIFYFFLVMCIIAFATNAVQFTPFNPIDNYILILENYLHINMLTLLSWTHQHTTFKNILIIIYNTLPYQMCILPLLMIAIGRFDLLREYYFLLLFTTLAGFSFYYFFPTTAPASILQSPLFFPEQIATGLKFFQIHHHINPTTNEGGLIALPSFHTIWALLCVYLIREWRMASALLLCINILLLISCVLLGWHYPVDIAGGIVLLIPGFYILNYIKNKY